MFIQLIYSLVTPFPLQNRMEMNLRHLYTFSVLRFYGAFVGFLEDAGYKGKHEFMERVELALVEANVSQAKFLDWQGRIKTSFESRNFFGMMIPDMDEDYQVNSKPLLKRVEAMEFVLKKVSTENLSLKQEIQDLRSGQQTIIRLLNSSLDLLLKKGDNSRPAQVSSDEESQDSNDPTQLNVYKGSYPSPWPEQQRLPKDVVYNPEHYPRNIACRSIFKVWFQDQLPVRWENMLDTVPKEKARKTRNQFSAFKKVVHVMIKHLKTYPQPDDNLEDVATEAMQSLMVKHNLDKEPNRSQIAGGSKNRVNGVRHKKTSLYETGCYDDVVFPNGTPECVVAFFENKGNNPVAGRKRTLDEG